VCNQVPHGSTHEQPVPVLLEVNFGCQDMFANSRYGTGNYMFALYAICFVVQMKGNIQVKMACHDVGAQKSDLILPWLMGTFPALEPAAWQE